MNSKTFKVSNEIYLDDFYNNPNYVQFDQIVFKCPTGIKINKKRFFSGGVYFINQDIIFKIEEEKLAIKIEENRMSLRLLFVFKFTDAIPFEGMFLGGGKITIYALANTLEKVILYNSGTGEIYQTFK